MRAETADSSPRTHRRQYDAAVVFVHGIGNQREGDTLTRGVDALLEAGGTRLSTRVPGDPNAVVVGARDSRGRQRTVVCIEGWWDQIIHAHAEAPRPWQVWAWSLLLLPFLMVSGAGVALFAALLRHQLELDGDVAPRAPARLGRLARLALCVLQSGFWRVAVVAPIVELVLLTVGGIWMLLESAWTRATGRSGPLANCLTFVLGDAWAYADSGVREDVLQYLCSRVQLARSRSQRVVVVGHSQGAALSRLLTAECSIDALVTVGSGAHYLGAARRRRWGRVVSGWSLVLLYGSAVALVLHLFVGSTLDLLGALWRELVRIWEATLVGIRDGSQAPTIVSNNHDFQHALYGSFFDPLTIMGIAVGLAGLVAARVIRVDEPTPDWGPPLVSHWVDIASIYDPVSVGGAGSAAAGVSLAVVNTTRLRDVLTEHGRYFSNVEVGRAIRDTALGEPLEPRYTVAAEDDHALLRASWAWGLLITVPVAYLGPLHTVNLILRR